MQISPTVTKFPFTLAAHCVAQYKMNDNAASTVVIDSQGYSNGTAQQNTEDLTTAGKINGALSFNGTNDYINTNATFASNVFNAAFTINLWVNLNQISSQQMFLYVEESLNVFYLKIMEDADNNCIEGSYRANKAGNATFCPQTLDNFYDTYSGWTMITFTCTPDGDGTSIYINTVLKGTEAGTMDMSAYDSTKNLFIGATWQGGGKVNGSIDNIMIFNKALSATEISFLYNTGEGTEELAYAATGNL